MSDAHGGNGWVSWQDDFPIEESHTSASGQEITFRIDMDESPTGYRATAQETDRSRGCRMGFRLSVFSPINPYLALGEFRRLIRTRLATRSVERSDGFVGLTHDCLVGVIDYAEEDGGPRG